MFAETSAQAEIQYRQQRFLDEAARHRLARQAQEIRRAERGARPATEASRQV
jgi:hypothetical protein